MQEAWSRRRRVFWLTALFLITTLGFAAYRHSSFVVWNDSDGVFRPGDGHDPAGQRQQPRALRQAPLAVLGSYVTGAFQSFAGGGYRPLSQLWKAVAELSLDDGASLPLALLLVIGALLGALAVSLFAVARRFVRHDGTALAAVALVLASPPLVASSWVCMAGVQAAVPLLFCLSLLCYWAVVERRRPILAGAALVLLLLFGPWLREFFGLNALLLLFLELRRTRRPTWLMAAAALGFLHALFPTALLHWLYLPELPLRPVYQLGTLSAALGDGVRWQAAWHFLPLLPPLLWVCGGVEALAGLPAASAIAARRPGDWLERLAGGVQVLAVPCWLLLLLVVLVAPPLQDLIGLVLCLGLAALGMRHDLFLGFWFLLMFVPILRVFTEHIHFLYAMPPAAIILAQAAESLWRRLRTGPHLAWMRPALAGVLALVGADQAMNVYGAYCVNHAAYEGIDAVADWFVRHVPEGTVVVCNVIHGEEIAWHSGNHIRNYWTVGAGINDPSRAVERPAELEALLANRGPHPAYFLDVDFVRPRYKVGYHSHKYVHAMDIDKRNLGVVHITDATYPFFDPLRCLVPKEFQPFLGAPDLVDDFGRGLARGRPFRHEVRAEYHVYEVTGDRVRARIEGPVVLEQEGVEGFNILRATWASWPSSNRRAVRGPEIPRPLLQRPVRGPHAGGCAAPDPDVLDFAE